MNRDHVVAASAGILLVALVFGVWNSPKLALRQSRLPVVLAHGYCDFSRFTVDTIDEENLPALVFLEVMTDGVQGKAACEKSVASLAAESPVGYVASWLPRGYVCEVLTLHGRALRGEDDDSPLIFVGNEKHRGVSTSSLGSLGIQFDDDALLAAWQRWAKNRE